VSVPRGVAARHSTTAYRGSSGSSNPRPISTPSRRGSVRRRHQLEAEHARKILGDVVPFEKAVRLVPLEPERETELVVGD